jgi:hypothetical protein
MLVELESKNKRRTKRGGEGKKEKREEENPRGGRRVINE